MGSGVALSEGSRGGEGSVWVASWSGSVRLSQVRELISHWNDIGMLPFGRASQHQTYSTRMEYPSMETFISERAHFSVNQSQEELTDSTWRFPGIIGSDV